MPAFGICAGGKTVGYVMVIYDLDVPEYDIWHMMIDASAQWRDYGAKRWTCYWTTSERNPSVIQSV